MTLHEVNPTRGDEYSRVAVDVALFNNREEVLLGRRLVEGGLHTWGFPGGRMRPGEKIKECAQRELEEELGKDIEVEITNEILAVRENKIPPQFVHHVTIIVKGFLKSGQPQVMELDKCSEWKFIALNELHQYPLFSGISETIRNFSQGKISVVTDWQ